MVRRASVDGSIITTRWYARPALVVLSSQPEGTPGQWRWNRHHRRTVRRAGVDPGIITAGWYSELALILASSLPDGALDQR
jgi:hypothetical protein